MKIMKHKKYGFTLVELIVVITILAILWTIAFINLQGYSSTARDSIRISDVKNIKTSLELFSLAWWKYPIADNSQDVTYSGWTIILWKQWTLWEAVKNNLWEQLLELPTDPLYNTEYIYSTLEKGSKYEIMSMYEESGSVKVEWTYNKLFIIKWNILVPSPSIITSESLPLYFNSTTIKSQVINEWVNVPIIGTLTALQSTWGLIFNDFQVYTGSLNKNSSNNEFLLAYNKLVNTYSNSSIKLEWITSSLLSKINDEDKIDFTKTLILNKTTTYWWKKNISITNIECTDAGWMRVDSATDVYIGLLQGNGFCISPRIGDFWDSTWGWISFNGWWNNVHWSYSWWNATNIDDSWNSNSTFGQTKKLNSSKLYTCKSLWTSNTDFHTLDNIIWRMEWLVINKENLIELQDIEWVQNAIPPNGHPIPAIYIADCIDWVKDLGTTMTYKHNDNTTDKITYTEFNTDVLNSDIPDLSNITYQNRQKYLTAWTQEIGSHLPSAFSYISDWTPWWCELISCDRLIWDARWEYQVACEWNLLTDTNDDTDNEMIWLSAIGHIDGRFWGRGIRVMGFEAQRYEK